MALTQERAQHLLNAQAIAEQLDAGCYDALPGETLYTIAQKRKFCVVTKPGSNAIFFIPDNINPNDATRALECTNRAYQDGLLSGTNLIKITPKMSERTFGGRSWQEEFRMECEPSVAGISTRSFVPIPKH